MAAAEPLFNNELKKNTSCYSDVLVVEGDLAIDGDFHHGSSIVLPDGVDWSEVLIAITGNLTVSGRVLFYDCYPGLWVAGETRAEAMVIGAPEVICKGLATIKHYILGLGSDGRMDVDATVPFVISERGHAVGVDASEALLIDSSGDYCRDREGYDYGSSDLETSFVAEVLTEDKCAIDDRKLYERLKTGLPVFLHGGDAETERLRLGLLRANG